METPVERYRSTDFYRTLVNTQQYPATAKHEDHRFIPNHKKVGNTWDAQHLDRFIDTKWGSGKASILTSRMADIPIENVTTQTNGQTQTQKTQKSDNFRPYTTQGTHYFRAGPRFPPEREKAYLINFTRDFTIKEAKLNTNNMVTNSKQDQDKLTRFFDKELTAFEKKFDMTKLEFSSQVNSLVSPQETRRQLIDIKGNQAEMVKFKQRKMEITKKCRIYKKGFKSGILGIDNSLNDDTMLYQEEYDALKRKKSDIEKIEIRRQQQLDVFTGTSSAVEFFNRKFDKTTSLPPAKIVKQNQKQKVDMEHTIRWQDSRDRLFGEPPVHYSVARAAYLKQQESKGKKYDIISSADTTLTLKSFRESSN